MDVLLDDGALALAHDEIAGGAVLPSLGDDRGMRGQVLAAARTDFLDFCSLLELQPKEGGGRIPFVLSPTQRALNAARTGRDVVLKGRQVHVTTLECARDLWTFLFRNGAHVVVVCQSQTDMKPFKDIAEKFRVFIDSLRSAGLDLRFGHSSAGEWTLPEQDSMLTIVQAGASAAAAVKKGRGGHINRLHCTETSVWEHADLTLSAMLPSVPGPESGSEIMIESTANGVGGPYYELWVNAVRRMNGYHPHFLRWWIHPEYRLALEPGEVVEPSEEPGKTYEAKLLANGGTVENLKWYRRKMAEPGMGKDKTLQEFPVDPDTCFLVSGRPFFDLDKVTVMLHEATSPALAPTKLPAFGAAVPLELHDVQMRGAFRVWKVPLPGRRYVLCVDTAEGVLKKGSKDEPDFSAGLVLDRNSGEHIATLHGRFPSHEFGRMLAAVGLYYNEALIVVERNNHGHAVHVALVHSIGYTHVYRHADEKLGWHTNPVTRPVMLDALDEAVRESHFKTRDALLLGEMRTFVVAENGKPRAAGGAFDDTVMAAAIGWQVRGRPSYEQAADIDISTLV